MHSDESVWKKTSHDVDLAPNVLKITKPIKTVEYLVEKSYKAKTMTELSVMSGTKVAVIERNLSGWWFVSSPDGEGYVPYTILEKKEPETPIVLEKGFLFYTDLSIGQLG